MQRLESKPKVFPAYAGMFPLRSGETHSGPRFPRIRGDVPSWSDIKQQLLFVFPAYAGMFPVGPSGSY